MYAIEFEEEFSTTTYELAGPETPQHIKDKIQRCADSGGIIDLGIGEREFYLVCVPEGESPRHFLYLWRLRYAISENIGLLRNAQQVLADAAHFAPSPVPVWDAHVLALILDKWYTDYGDQ